jgi:hypothetical protein
MKTAHKIGLARAAYRAIHFGRTIIDQSDRCVVTRAGLNYDLDLSQGIDFAIYLGIFERSTRKALRKLVEPSALVLDIGANIYVFRGSFGMMARARACSRRDWSADASCGHRWQTVSSRSALRNYPIFCPELTGACRRPHGVHRLPVKRRFGDCDRMGAVSRARSSSPEAYNGQPRNHRFA